MLVQPPVTPTSIYHGVGEIQKQGAGDIMMAATQLWWFARHELRLSWREWFAMMTAGRRARLAWVIIGLVIFSALVHMGADAMIRPLGSILVVPTRTTFIVVSIGIAFVWTVVLSQAIESVTRVFYARADLDLIMSSPFALAVVIAVRMAAVALMMVALVLILFSPAVDVLAYRFGERWLAGYAVIVCIGLSSTAVALFATVLLFHVFGPRRARLVAQIVSAVVGAGVVVGLQFTAMYSSGDQARFTWLTSEAIAASAPAIDSVAWLPARAMLGDGLALTAVVAGSGALLVLAMIACGPVFRTGFTSIATSGAPAASVSAIRPFRRRSQAAALRWKEFMLLRRDPWLVSQTLMQLLYLAPAAVVLWRTFGGNAGPAFVMIPMIVMAAGQLAGGIAWLSISAEDAPDFIATAPLPPGSVIRAKIEAVLLAIGAVLVLPVVPMAIASVPAALITIAGAAVAAVSATAIQLWFRAQAKRSQFRRRHTSSRLATIAETFASMGWAAVAATVLISPIVAAIMAAFTLCILALTWMISPRRA